MKNRVKSQIEESVKRFAEIISKERDFITLDEVTYELWGEKCQVGQHKLIPKLGYKTTIYEDRWAIEEIMKYGKYMTCASFKIPKGFDWGNHPILHGTKKILVFDEIFKNK
ncbi:hypothetical protein [Algoriphagus taiwanensis]|uniref:Uncharacterized protein n=1 Tax=Algoriphagus taiwanensis TaxID=1445656 RepID=A0ABQ6Q002_9BACT|nr:hypothetical protein Ataiwa_17950 [Algoriphagus taiwanensis]